MRKAKIICTMGPASREEPTLGKLVAAGMDCARLNFSHGTQEDHARAIVSVRRAAETAGRPIAILADLGLREGIPASRALGYRQLLDVLDGRSVLAEAVTAR